MEHIVNIRNKARLSPVSPGNTGTAVPTQMESERFMFTVIAATVFLAAFLLAAGTIVGMFALYRDKMVAALLFEPIPQEAPVYRLRISRRRAVPDERALGHVRHVSMLAA